MTTFNRKAHWEHIYQTKELEEVSWFQAVPETSLKLIEKCQLKQDAKLIDIGGGDSFLVDHLLKQAYQDITVLDISEAAVTRAKKRLGKSAELVHWIVSDIVEFTPTQTYDLWHDRAAFHFLTHADEVHRYVQTVKHCLKPGGYFILGTFSEQGPEKCSGIAIQQYSEQRMGQLFEKDFERMESLRVEHATPFGTTQSFLFGVFRKK